MDLRNKPFHGIYVLYSASIVIVPSVAFIRDVTFSRDVSYDNLLPVDENLTSSTTTKSNAECAKFCFANDECNSYFYNHHTRLCLHRRLIRLSTSAAVSTSGWRYFRMDTSSVCSDSEDYIADRLSSSCYRIDMTKMTWDNGRDACASKGETLVVLEPVVKAEFVRDHLLANWDVYNTNFYIGASQTAGQGFVWLNGEPVNLTATLDFWAEDKSINDHKPVLMMRKPSGNYAWTGGWAGNKKKSTICERPFL